MAISSSFYKEIIMKEFLQKHRKRIIAGAVVLCVLGGGTYYYMHSEGSKQTQNLYTTGKVEKGDVKTSISATGTINPVNYVDVSTNVAGKLEKVLVKENDQVTAGQVIAYIDTRQLQASADDARAALAKAELDMNRYKALADQNAIAQQTYDDSVTAYERAKSAYDRAAAEIYLTVDETDIGSIKQGAKVEFTVDSKPGETFTGYVSEIAKGTKGNMGATSNSVVYYTVKVQIPENISNNFLPSMTARATIFGEDIKNTLVVPLTAVRTDKQGEYVYVIKDGQPVRTAVSTGVTGDTNVQILKGLSEGDEIIASGDVTAPKNNSRGPF